MNRKRILDNRDNTDNVNDVNDMDDGEMDVDCKLDYTTYTDTDDGTYSDSYIYIHNCTGSDADVMHIHSYCNSHCHYDGLICRGYKGEGDY